jgi:hypothetical protein
MNKVVLVAMSLVLSLGLTQQVRAQTSDWTLTITTHAIPDGYDTVTYVLEDGNGKMLASNTAGVDYGGSSNNGISVQEFTVSGGAVGIGDQFQVCETPLPGGSQYCQTWTHDDTDYQDVGFHFG